MIHRREFVGLSLAAGVGAVLPLVRAQDATPAEVTASPPPRPAGYLASSVHRAHPLEFRLDDGYLPDLSDGAAEKLVRAVLEFLSAEHPGGLSITFWNLHPSRMPFLPKHMERVVEHLFRGIADNRGSRPVDPIVVLALLYNESRFHPTVVSPAGAAGIAQFMPDTAVDYGLTPTARPELWAASREARAAHREARDKKVSAFRARHGWVAFKADAVLDRAVSTDSLEILKEYAALRDEVDPSKEALRAYIDAIEKEFAALQFFGDGREALEALDARISYRAVEATVRYLARALDTNQGLVSSSVASYNAGFDAVRVRDPRSILHRFGDLPTYPETVRYVQRFLAVYSAIKYRLYLVDGVDAPSAEGP